MKLINDLTERAKRAAAQNDTELATVCLNAIEAICELHRAGKDMLEALESTGTRLVGRQYEVNFNCSLERLKAAIAEWEIQ